MKLAYAAVLALAIAVAVYLAALALGSRWVVAQAEAVVKA